MQWAPSAWMYAETLKWSAVAAVPAPCWCLQQSVSVRLRTTEKHSAHSPTSVHCRQLSLKVLFIFQDCILGPPHLSHFLGTAEESIRQLYNSHVLHCSYPYYLSHSTTSEPFQHSGKTPTVQCLQQFSIVYLAPQLAYHQGKVEWSRQWSVAHALRLCTSWGKQ